MTHYIRLGGISIPDIKLYSVPVFRFEPLVMSEIEGVRTVGLVCASKYIVDIWRTSWTASTIQKWPLASFEGLTVVPIFVSDRFDDRLLRFIHTFISHPRKDLPVSIFVHRSRKFHRTNYFEVAKRYLQFACISSFRRENIYNG